MTLRAGLPERGDAWCQGPDSNRRPHDFQS